MTTDTVIKRKQRSGGLWSLAWVFAIGVVVGVFLTIIAVMSIPDPPDTKVLDAKPQKINQAPNSRSTKSYWVETISDLPGPRIYILHNFVTKEETEHLKSLGIIKGMEKALIIPYGGKDLIESSTRTNTGAWLEFAQDEVVRKVERAFADFTNTEPENGENLQVNSECLSEVFFAADPLNIIVKILHYASTQQFKEHHDYFDPAEDPPENFEPGGNRLATGLIYLQNAEQGGETDFMKVGIKLKPAVGDAVLFYDLKPDGAVDKQTIHAGTPPVGHVGGMGRGDKWVATKWIHERRYQGLSKPVRASGGESKGAAVTGQAKT